MQNLIKKPLISEKSMKLAKMGLYTFLVDRSISRNKIAQLVENYFKVDVLEVKVANYKDKVKLQKSRKGMYKLSGFKKAIVKVKPGQKIDLFEAEEAEKEEPEVKPKEKKSLLSGTKVKIEKASVDKQENIPVKSKKKKEVV